MWFCITGQQQAAVVYDPSSKCFSYVPAKSLKEHYKAPKKPPPRRPSIERSNLDISPREEEELKKEISFIGSNLHKRAETPKWDEEITKLAGDLPTESDYKRKAAEEWRRNRRDDYMPYSEDDYFERPVVVEHSRQANRQQRSPPRRRFGSFSANDSSGDMDELCDPDYYMSFSNNNGTNNPERRSKSVIPYGSRHGGNADPRQPFRTVSQRDLDDLNDLIDYNSKLPPSGRSYTPKPAHSQSFDRDAYRTRNSRSVNALPTKGSAQYFAHENYDPLKDSEDPDDWLRSKLHTLRQRRRNDPAVARRQVERDLLEELKNTSTNVPSRPVQPKQQQFNQNPPQQQFNQNPPQQQGHQSRAPRSTQPAQQVQQHNPMRQAAVHQAPNYSDEPRGPNQPWQYSPNIDRLRQANRENMDHTFRSKTPNYYSNTGTFDRAAAVRQRSATPNILLPTNQQQSRLPLQIARETPTLPSHSSDPFDFVPQKPRPYSAVPLTTPPKRDFAAPPTPKSERSPRDSYPPRIDPTSTPQKFKAKPPTPPPASRRDRSASPATSPLFGKKPQIVIDSERRYQEKLEKEARERNGNGHSSPTPREEPPRRPTASSNYGQIYQRVLPPVTGASTSRPQDLSSQKRAANSRLNDEYSDDEQGHDFGYLKNIVQNGRRDVPTPSSQYTSTTKSILKRPGSQDYGYSVGTGSTSGYNYYGPTGHTDTIDSLSSSRLSNPEIYAAPTPPSQRRFGGRQVEDSDYAATNRSDTPQFPVGSIQSRGDTPLPYHPLLYQGASQQAPPEQQQNGYAPINSRTESPRSMYYSGSRRSSLTSDTGEVIHHHPIFMRDTSKYWYKPTISREEAIAMLKDKEPGTFVVRDSNSFPGAFGLALKVAQPPAGVQPGDGTELVRHFLIEPSAKGVKLKGCSNEPVFGTLAALIYQHSITPLALPAKLLLPDGDPATTPEHLNANQALLERGAACNVTYICSLDTESLTGPEAVRRAVLQGLQLLQQRALRAVPVHFKVSSQGITLTDNTRTLFFRRHYPVTTVTFAGIDPESRLFDNNHAQQLPPTYIRQAPMFGFVARKSPSSPDNSCHIFAELDPEQPASAVVRFITNVMLVYARAQQQQIHRAVAGV
ncbi:Tensin-4 [Aphelenchoides bicaudatus]|nr:Tensin-4 [Aphelenchoides bicaudatus]